MLRGERLFYLYDQFGATKYSVAVGYNLGACSLIIAIRKSCACSSPAFHYDPMPLIGELSHRRRHNTDAVLVIFDLFWHADQHGDLFRLCAGKWLHNRRAPIEKNQCPKPKSGL